VTVDLNEILQYSTFALYIRHSSLARVSMDRFVRLSFIVPRATQVESSQHYVRRETKTALPCNGVDVDWLASLD
jgi:hypothetical protein